jgi:threonine dehydratase
MGAFKFRGGFNALSCLDAQQRKRGVLAFSSGNHAQAVALAARLLDVPAAILMPLDAPASKVAATRGYGAEVILFDRYKEDREALARKLADERGMTLVPPFDDPAVIAGQGTAAKELFDEIGRLDHLFVCVGGGGLISGCALAARALSPQCKVWGVEPEAGNDVQQSFAAGRRIKIEVPRTIADGAQTQSPGEITFPLIQRDVDGILTASDAQLVECMRFFAERMKMVVEPTGCLSYAGARASGLDLKGARVGIVVSGGNIDLARFSELVQ